LKKLKNDFADEEQALQQIHPMQQELQELQHLEVYQD
jgi:hypothetical protein